LLLFSRHRAARHHVLPAVRLLLALTLGTLWTARIRAAATGDAAPSAAVAVPLVRTSTNHYGVEASIDGHPVMLALDTGSPTTLIDKGVYSRFVPPGDDQQLPPKLQTLNKSDDQRSKVGWIADLQAGPMHFGGGPVRVMDLAAVSGATSLDYRTKVVAGFLGVDLLAKYHAVIYWANHTVYFTQPGGRLDVRGTLLANGWTAVPMEFTSGRHLAVPCSLSNSYHLIVDTGMPFTEFDRGVWGSQDVGRGAHRTLTGLADSAMSIAPIILKEWQIGSFPMTNTAIGIGKVNGHILDETTATPGRIIGFLGSEWLVLREAIIDVDGMTLYLKKPVKPGS
jgi:hypothetical protein